ncbi:DUF488 domain-containing protein, partial [Klebsiella pneumoniae]|nr:DUF488 domain-containing protein [Klebsiella pneumoniae]
RPNPFQGVAIFSPHFRPRFGLAPPPQPYRGRGGGGGAPPPPLTLLYAAKNTEQNHARVLAAWLAALPVTI